MFRPRAVLLVTGFFSAVESIIVKGVDYGFNVQVEAGSSMVKMKYSTMDRLNDGQKAMLTEFKKITPGTPMRIFCEQVPNYKNETESVARGFILFDDTGKQVKSFGDVPKWLESAA